MTQLERQIRAAQHRLWFSRWLHDVSWSIGAAAAVFVPIVLIQRLYGAPIPLFWIGAGLVGGALVGSVLWMISKREDAAFAAVTLDEAAGLRERLSSGRYCQVSDDPFARAVLADAERVSRSLSVRQHVRISTPRSFALTAALIVVAAVSLAIPPGLLKSSEATEDRESAESELRQTKIAVKRKMDAVRKMAEANPVLQELKEDLDNLDKEAGGKLERPPDVRHEAVKKIDRLADVVKQRRKSGKYESVKEMRKILRGLKVPGSSDAPTQKLAKALLNSDFKSARKEIKALREQLATLKTEQDRAMVVKISKQLDDLARQLEKLSRNEKLAQKLQQAGIKKEDLERMLENLTKEDLDRLKKRLEEKGMSQQQIDKLAKQLQRRQQAGGIAKRLAQAMGQGALGVNPVQMDGALAGLSLAADQLGELEQLEQEMNQLDVVLADLQSAKDDLSRPCLACKGAGCSQCQGNRGGMGRLARGRGGLAPEEQTAIDFKIERGKVRTGKGAIIGQFLFDGQQVKGDVTSSFAEIVTAAEHEASDRINRDRIPRQYHKAVKAYFSNVQRSIQTEERPTGPGKPGIAGSVPQVGGKLQGRDQATETTGTVTADESTDQMPEGKQKD